jgi:thiamine-phosphate pyrophosphorylase
MNAKKLGRLHVLTDFYFQQRFSPADLAELALEGGADTIQLREKRQEIRHILLQADEVAEVCRKKGSTFLVNDRLDVALATRADGVHLGQTDFPIHRARAILGEHAIIGATATSLKQAIDAAREGADYIGYGPVFQTRSKANPASVKGLSLLRTVCAQADVPVVAIGGITAHRIASVFEAGAFGVAVMTAVTVARDPAAATALLREAIDDMLAK